MGKEGKVCSCTWVGRGRRGESAHAGGLVEGGGESLPMQVGWLGEEGLSFVRMGGREVRWSCSCSGFVC